MNDTLKINYFLRKPAYPILIDIDGLLICGKSGKDLLRKLNKAVLPSDKVYPIIDNNVEGFAFHHNSWIITPLTTKKKWTKIEIIRLYNNRTNQNDGSLPYSEKSLSAKRKNQIFDDIIKRMLST